MMQLLVSNSGTFKQISVYTYKL